MNRTGPEREKSNFFWKTTSQREHGLFCGLISGVTSKSQQAELEHIVH